MVAQNCRESLCPCSRGPHPLQGQQADAHLAPIAGRQCKDSHHLQRHASPAVHADESHSTLRFACRAKRVVNNAMVNEVLSDAAVLKRQAKEIEELRKVLAASGGG